MLKISKTEFKRLHKNNKLELFGNVNSKEKSLAPLKKLYRSGKLCTQNTTNINIDNVKDYSKNTIFKSFPFVFVEVNITDKTYGKSNYTICYVIKKIKE